MACHMDHVLWHAAGPQLALQSRCTAQQIIKLVKLGVALLISNGMLQAQHAMHSTAGHEVVELCVAAEYVT